VLQHAKHAGTKEVWGHAPPGKFLKIDAKIETFRNAFILPYCVATACVYRKVSVSSNSHMMHPLMIGMWEHSIHLLWLIVLKEFQGGQAVQPPEAERFLQSKGIKIP